MPILLKLKIYNVFLIRVVVNEEEESCSSDKCRKFPEGKHEVLIMSLFFGGGRAIAVFSPV